MKSRFYLTTFILILIFSGSCYSQNTLGGSIELANYKFRVKQIGEFMERFNLKEIIIDRNDSLWKQKNLTMLFNRDSYIKSRATADIFIKNVIRDSVTLHYNDTNWYAEAECNAKLNGKAVSVTLSLKVEHIERDLYKWVITGAKSKALALSPDKVNPGLKISPVDNEVNFMSLNHITTVEARNIKNYTEKDSHVDEFSVFLALIFQKALSIENVQRLVYHFQNVAGYSFAVQHYERDNMNAGWLISDIEKAKQF